MDNLIERKHLFVLMLAGLLISSGATLYAQEGSPDYGTLNPEIGEPEDYNTAETYNNDETLIIEKPAVSKKNPSLNVKKPTTSKGKKIKPSSDSTKTSSGPETGVSTAGNENESVLSFNFLYYIIQKFKFTEVVDQ